MDNRDAIYEGSISLDNENDSRAIIINNYITNNSKILDVGCACGDLGVAVKQKYSNCEIYGLEYSQGSIDIALTKNAYKDIKQIDLDLLTEKSLPEYIDKFDYIVCADVLEHLKNPSNVLKILSIFLKKNGFLLISIPNVSNSFIKADLLFNNFTYTETGLLDKTHLRFFTYYNLANLMTESNLKVVDSRYTIDLFTRITRTPYRQLPFMIKLFIFKDRNSYVFQYILKTHKQDKENLAEHNLQSVYLTKKNCPANIRKIRRKKLLSIFINPIAIILVNLMPFKKIRDALRNFFY